jgi:carotenoid cleavage dioxygenase-like enzyme
MTHYNRRNILKAFGALTAASALPMPVMAKTASKPDWFIGWQNPAKHRLETASLRKVSGNLPAELSGTFYRNGPAIHERAGKRMHHWFDGEGMMQSFKLGDGQVSHLGRMIETDLYKQNEAAGEFTVGGFGTHIDAGYPMRGPDSANAANTSVLPIGDEVWALWEGGSAYRLKADSLETIGSKVWTEGLRGMPFSAHPRIDKKGNIWNFGQSVQMQALVIYKLSPSGELLASKLIKDVPGGMIHDFCITDRKLIFVAPSFRAVKHGKFYLDMFEYQKDAPQRVVVLDMDDLDDRQDYDLPPGFQFHFGNAYADKSGDIRFTLCLTDKDDIVSRGAKAWMRGELDESGKTVLHEAVLKTNGSASIAPVTDKAATHEFPQFNKAYGGRSAQYLYTLGNSSKNHPGETAVLRHDLKSGDLQSYDYGATVMLEEHLFIGAETARNEDDGWLIGTTLDYKTKKTRLNVLRADRLSDGPIAVFELPYALPLGFHGAWKGA